MAAPTTALTRFLRAKAKPTVDLLHRLTEPHPEVEHAAERRDARLLASLLLGFLTIGTAAQAAFLILAPPAHLGSYLLAVPFIIGLVIAYRWSRTRRHRSAAIMAVAIMAGAIYAGGLDYPQGVLDGFFDFLLVPLLFASVFLQPRHLFWLLAAGVALMLATPIFRPELTLEFVLLGPITFLIMSGLVLLIFAKHRNNLERDRQAELPAPPQRYRTLVEQTPAITYLDVEDPSSPSGFRPLFLSPQFEAWLGYTISEYQANPALWMSLIHPDDRQRVDKEDTRHYATQTDSIQEYRLMARDGRILWVRDHARMRWDQLTQKQVSQGILLDVTGIKQAADELRREAARSAALLRVAERLNTLLDLDSLLEVICAETARALSLPLATVNLYDERKDLLQPSASSLLTAEQLASLPPVARELHQRAFSDGKLVAVVRNLSGMPNLPGAAQYAQLGARSVALANMEYNGSLIGSLNAVSLGKEHPFGQDELMLLQGLADQAALAIVNTRLYKDAQRRLAQLQALRAIDIAITTNQQLHQTLDVLLVQITGQLSVDAAVVLLLNSADQSLAYAHGRGFHTPALQHSRLRLGQGMAGQAALDGRWWAGQTWICGMPLPTRRCWLRRALWPTTRPRCWRAASLKAWWRSSIACRWNLTTNG